MANLTLLQRKAAVLRFRLEKLNLWPAKADDTILPHYNHLTGRTIENWRSGNTKRPKKLDIYNDCLNEIFMQSRAQCILEESVTFPDFLEATNSTQEDAHYAVDTLYGELNPTFSSFSMPEETASKVAQTLSGRYLIYRIESTEQIRRTRGANMLIRIPLSVRYTLPGTKKYAQTRSRIRCKLSIPSYRKHISKGFFEFDGYVTDLLGNEHYWVFERRDSKSLLFLVSEALENTILPHTTYAIADGILLSKTQERNTSPGLWRVVIVRANDMSGPEHEFMEDMASILNLSDIDPYLLRRIREPWSSLFVNLDSSAL